MNVHDSLYSVFYLKETQNFLLCSNPKKAFIHFKNFKINLLTSEKVQEPISKLKEEFSKVSINTYRSNPLVYHLYYELGFLFQSDEDRIPSRDPLLISIEYKDSQNFNQTSVPTGLKLNLLEFPTLKSYKKKFKKVHEELIKGNCYQVNLTHPFYFKSDEELESSDYLNCFLTNKDKLGAYAHFTYINALDKVFLSNSPECLFKSYEKNGKMFVRSMPIKGTIRGTSKKDWEKLKKSTKDEAELYMITDLVRNDLTRIKMTPSRVLKKKERLRVPGITHQFSIVETAVKEDTSLLDLLVGLFPGGSITGAPKKRVMEIIDNLEGYRRGFYCGSTVLFHKTLRCGSINIRSSEVSLDKNEIKYGSGGGVTLKSDCEGEFDESYQKMHSFLQFLDVEKK